MWSNTGKTGSHKKEIPSIHFLQCYITKPEECGKLRNRVQSDYPECNILGNNAAIVTRENFYEDEDAVNHAKSEIATNLIAPIQLSKIFFPILEKNKQSKIIKVMFPAVDTPWHDGNPSAIAISLENAVTEMIHELEKGKEKIRLGR